MKGLLLFELVESLLPCELIEDGHFIHQSELTLYFALRESYKMYISFNVLPRIKSLKKLAARNVRPLDSISGVYWAIGYTGFLTVLIVEYFVWYTFREYYTKYLLMCYSWWSAPPQSTNSGRGVLVTQRRGVSPLASQPSWEQLMYKKMKFPITMLAGSADQWVHDHGLLEILYYVYYQSFIKSR